MCVKFSFYTFAKRLIDIVIVASGILILSPIWFILAILIKIDSSGPVIYQQERIGKDGNVFPLYKFRSMLHRAEKSTGPVCVDKDDPRVTKIGAVLRKLHLDETPQFMNVLKGDMSIVGPRPERLHFIKKLEVLFPDYYRRYKVRPGITGLSQINHEYDPSQEGEKRKLDFDLEYIENQSLLMDIKIILKTIALMFRLTGR